MSLQEQYNRFDSAGKYGSILSHSNTQNEYLKVPLNINDYNRIDSSKTGSNADYGRFDSTKVGSTTLTAENSATKNHINNKGSS